jgi:hypothetical protein
MKRYFILVIILVNYISMYSQSIPNKLNIGIGTNVCFPLNSNDVTETKFKYPSLYGNYQAGYAGLIMLEYELNSKYSVNLSLEKSRYNNWEGNEHNFILSKPSINITSYSFSLKYTPERLQLNDYLFKWGIFLAPIMAAQKLKWDEINQSSDDNFEYPKSEKNFLPGFKTGFEMSYFTVNSILICSQISYQYLKCNSNYYMDKSFQSINISIVIKYKLFKNRYFKYE